MLRGIRTAGVDRIWCLGDLVGYGADPDFCVRTCVARSERCLAGNHDLAVAGIVGLERFAGHAHAALTWTREALSPALITQLGVLKPSDTTGPAALFHASPLDPIWQYVLSGEEALDILRETRTELNFVGHTHLPAAWRMTSVGDLEGGFVAGEGSMSLTPGRWLINPGSVGQPRDGDARAAWLLLDLDAKVIVFRRTPYDVAAAQGAILKAGLPSVLATRLADGR